MNFDVATLNQHLKNLIELNPRIGWLAIIGSDGNLITSANLNRDHQENTWQRLLDITSEMRDIVLNLGQDQMTHIQIMGLEQQQKILIFPIRCLEGLLVVRLHQPVKIGLVHLDISRMLDEMCNSEQE